MLLQIEAAELARASFLCSFRDILATFNIFSRDRNSFMPHGQREGQRNQANEHSGPPFSASSYRIIAPDTCKVHNNTVSDVVSSSSVLLYNYTV